MIILLFDMDDVLILPGGYHTALQATVAAIGRVLGYRNARLTAEDIAHFEAAGSTSEWDTAAICAALLLADAWQVHPDLRLPEDNTPVTSRHNLAAPALGQFAHALAQTGPPEAGPRQRAERLILAHPQVRTPEQAETVRRVLWEARDAQRSLTFRLFQELVVGSQAFAEAYARPPTSQIEPYLQRFDRPALAPAELADLRAWLAERRHAAAIFTNRPTRSPDGSSGTPEGEIGAQIAGLADLPLIGLGALNWLSANHGLPPESYIKPSPVHALAALRAALGDPVVEALSSAAQLAAGQFTPGWATLDGAEVHAFEDTAKGLQSARAAQKILSGQGVTMRLSLYGVSQSAPKIQALQSTGAAVYPSLGPALDEALRGSRILHG